MEILIMQIYRNIHDSIHKMSRCLGQIRPPSIYKNLWIYKRPLELSKQFHTLFPSLPPQCRDMWTSLGFSKTFHTPPLLQMTLRGSKSFLFTHTHIYIYIYIYKLKEGSFEKVVTICLRTSEMSSLSSTYSLLFKKYWQYFVKRIYPLTLL